MQLIDAFLADFADVLGADIRKSSIASLWEDIRPDMTNEQSVQDYLDDTYANTNFHDYYYNKASEFGATYEERYRKRPYGIPFNK